MIKKFGDKKINIRQINKNDIKNAKKFLVFINALVDEPAKILRNKRATLKEEIDFINKMIKGYKDKTKVLLLAEHDGQIAGNTSIELDRHRKNHIGQFAIAIAKEYRGLGLGEYLAREVIKIAKKQLKPTPKIIQLEVYENNKPAQGLYKKVGFKIVAKIPKQIQWEKTLVSRFFMIKNV